ncbi:MAG: DNA (cytosine-5-)-methyltransferase [Oscillospiraceae bacterium]|nr:DNA (cytosine-5-)-methyltransferase [Oscillospiraceae bacterium]
MFAGIGGICSGFLQAGFEIVWANELDKAACRTYRHNFGDGYLVEGDIETIDAKSIPNFDVLTAGFPCQSFSIGGTQKGFKDTRGILFFEIARIIDAKRPKVIFLENVENLVEHDEGRTFLVIYNVLVQCGYSVRYKVIPTNEYGGVPQARKRIYIVAFLDLEKCDSFAFPKTIQLDRKIADIVNQAIKKNDIYYYNPDTPLYNKIDAFIGKSRRLFRIYNGTIRNLRNPDLCSTLTASMNTIYNAIVLRDDHGIRRLTLQESLDFQGFPNDFYFPNTIRVEAAYKQIGNSVSVPVVKRIADRIKAVL